MHTVTQTTYEVLIEYCDDTMFTHDHTVAMNATTEYAERILEAIEPSMGHPEARHVRQVWLVVWGEKMLKVTSGVFLCEHRSS